MSNKDIIVSSEKGTILNYFGAADTYNPFTNENNMQLVEDLDFKIPEKTALANAEWAAVSTGLITASISFLQNCTFQIADKNSGAKITDLTNIIGEAGNTRFMPSKNQIFWFNIDGLRGTFYVHKDHCGHYLKIVSGVFVSTSITSGVLNEMFARSIGVPNYITNINNTLNEQNKKIDDLKNKINNNKIIVKAFHTAKKSPFDPLSLTPCSLEECFSKVYGWFCYYQIEKRSVHIGGGDSGTNYITNYYDYFKAGEGFSIPALQKTYELLVLGKPK